jgi:murein DD-endopeptidase MepM/ murein hydrolase activator NlpD
MAAGLRPVGTAPATREAGGADRSAGSVRVRRALAAACLLWTAAATGYLVIDLAAERTRARDLALLQASYEARIAAEARAARSAEEARQVAEARYVAALDGIAERDAAILRLSETRTADQATAALLRARLAEAERLRDQAAREARLAAAALAGVKGALAERAELAADLTGTLAPLAAALAENVRRREAAEAEAARLAAGMAELEAARALADRKMDRLLGRIEEAVELSIAQLEGRLKPTGLDIDTLVGEIRASYSGQGGTLLVEATPVAFTPDDPDSARLGALLSDLERAGLMRMAADKLPLARPVRGSYLVTSLFGRRRGRVHEGIDFAGDRGTPIVATADGVITFAGRMSGYGNLIKVRHAFGIETFYAHLSAIRVKVGQRVALGERIGDMGNTGRSTGTHLHYEVHVNGTPVDPMTYLKAARDVL